MAEFSIDGISPIDRSNLTLADRVEVRLREQIVEGERRPGSRLNEVEISADLGVSRGPVREALQRLAHVGLVTLESHRGAFVRRLTLDEVTELFEIRIALECAAAELAAARISDDAVETLVRLQGESAERVARGEQPDVTDSLNVHDMIVHHAGNTRLTQEIDQLSDELVLVRSRSGHAGARPSEIVHEHGEVLGFVQRRDPVGAREAMRKHLEASMATTLELVSADTTSSDEES